jgi:hypothetical protein
MGKVRLSDCIQPLVAKYDFQVYPSKTENFDLDKGVRLGSGKAEDLVIDSLVIYGGAICLDTLASTGDSKRILTDILEWARVELGLSYETKSIRRWVYINDVVFRSDIPILSLQSSSLQKLVAKTSAVTEDILGGLKYVPIQISIGHDPTVRKYDIAKFVITHRVNTTLSENIYFSEAPLPTHLHLQFLQEFEEDIKNSMR